MRAILIAHTQVNWGALTRMGYDPHIDGEHADELAEAAGRLCYESFDRPNPATASNGTYLRNIINQQHFSVVEHASATFFIDGVSRSLTHELVRHRHLSFSQVSQRYVDHSERAIVYPPAIPEELTVRDGGAFYDVRLLDELDAHKEEALSLYRSAVDAMDNAGLPRKVVRGAARAFLLESTETKIVVTGNHRAWRDMLAKRLSLGADQEIRELAQLILDELVKIAPNTYQDM